MIFSQPGPHIINYPNYFACYSLNDIFTAWTSHNQLSKLLCMLFSEWYFHSLDLTYSTIQTTLWLHVIPWMIFSQPGPHIFKEPNYFLIAHYSLNDIFTDWISHSQRTRLLFDCTLFLEWCFHSLDLTYWTIQTALYSLNDIFTVWTSHIQLSKLLCRVSQSRVLSTGADFTKITAVSHFIKNSNLKNKKYAFLMHHVVFL